MMTEKSHWLFVSSVPRLPRQNYKRKSLKNKRRTHSERDSPFLDPSLTQLPHAGGALLLPLVLFPYFSRLDIFLNTIFVIWDFGETFMKFR